MGRGNKHHGKLQAKPSQREILIEQLLEKCTHFNKASIDEIKELFHLQEQIRTIEKDLIKPFPERHLHMKAFLEWCSNNGVDTSKVYIAGTSLSESDFGLRSKADLSEDEVIFEIPRKIMISTENAFKDNLFANFIEEDPIVKTMPNILLALFLINEVTKKDSFWKPYIDILPSSFTTPLYLSSTEIGDMLPSPWFEEAVKLCRSIGRQYAYFWKQLNSNKSASHLHFKQHFTYELYRWAVSAVMTRQNFIPSSDGNGMINALIPLWDLCNHVNGKHSTDFDIDKDAALCYAISSFKIDEEIKIFYGSRSNGEFLIHNGFVYNDNAHDYLPIKLGISKNDKLFTEKSALCAKVNLQSSDNYKLYKKSYNMDEKLLAFLRIFNMDEGEVKTWSSQDDLKPLFVRNEGSFKQINLKVNQFLKTRASLLIRGYSKPKQVSNEFIQCLHACEKSILESYLCADSNE